VSLAEEVELLRRIPLFANIEKSKLKLLAFTSEKVTFHAGETVFHQDDVANCAYIVMDGEADIIINTPGGPLTVAHVGPNDVVGEIAILCDVPRTATVLATTPLAALRVSKEGFFKLVEQFPQIGIEIMGELASRLHQTTQRLTETTARLRMLETQERA
jgi:CRP/FNR family transcriptional regulator, cyclic AMP receptor protein